MIGRIIDLSESPAYVHSRDRQMVIQLRSSDGQSPPPAVQTPLSEVAALIVSHAQCHCSQPLLADLVQAGGAFIVCDDRRLPVGMMVSLVGNCVQTRRMALQAAISQPRRKALWKQIVRWKILAQGALLTELRGDDFGLADLAGAVRSGDPDNREAVAARRYWQALFEDSNFHRRFDAPDANRLLNYGYAVLRAIMARAICGAGLHPSLGLHHHHRENAYCLADDLMEPFRPLIDAAVVEHMGAGNGSELDREGKQAMLEAILARYAVDGESRTLFDLSAGVAVSLVQVLEKQSTRLNYPKKWSDAA